MGQMTGISRGDGTGYSMSYTSFHQLQGIQVTQKDNLVIYRYKEGNGRLRGIYYGDGSRVDVKYTAQGQIASETWYNSENTQISRYKYVYDSEGNLSSSIDVLSKKIYNYTYEGGVLKRSTESEIEIDANEIIRSKDVIHTTQYFYDEKGTLLRKTITDKAGSDFTYRYTELESQSVTASFTAGGKTVQSHSKADGFGRMIFDELRLGTGFLNRQFTYHDGVISQTHEENGKKISSPTTNLVKEIVYSDGRTIAYEYDPEERISKVTDSVDGVTEYTYDALGQLTSETVNGVKTAYVYDGYGNLQHKGVCNGEGVVPLSDRIWYSYGDPCWDDLLTAYNGRSIRYDKCGNPISYLGHTFTWEKGRQLKSFDSNTYTYNANGIRTGKTVDGVQHTYTLDGTNIVRESWGDNTLMSLYDNGGTVCGILYNGTPYYFVKNLQGDVLSIADANGDTVARYRYDAWGKCTIVSDTSTDGIAAVNPYRYRTYYFDSEIGLYYLQSRYYDPETGRFINADDANYVASNGYNLFSYCGNNPVLGRDPSGRCNELYGPTTATLGFIHMSATEDDTIRGIISDFQACFDYTKIRRQWIKGADGNALREFQQAWAYVDGCTFLIIDTHGSPNRLSSKAPAPVWSITPHDTFSLPNSFSPARKLNVDFVLLTGCNTAHLDYKDTIAAILSKHITGVLVASDGDVEIDPHAKNSDGQKVLFTSFEGEYWRERRDSAWSKRKTKSGWIVFRNGKRIMTTNKKEFTIKSLFKYMDRMGYYRGYPVRE